MLSVILLVVLCASTASAFGQCAGFGQSCRVGGYPGGGNPGYPGGYPGYPGGYPGYPGGYPGYPGGYPGYPGGYPGYPGYPGGSYNRPCCTGQRLICRSTGMGGTMGTCMRAYI